jgi:glycosyltransferase involved in cell wall biosynthesis
MSENIKLSVVIITYNEERNIERCVNTIETIADEILIVDSFSNDKTIDILRNKNCKIIQHKFEGHIEQKNFAITQAKYPHILSVDADEFPDEKFLSQIKSIKMNWIYDGYTINRLNNYCGKWIRHGAWYPDKKLRLWDSRKGFWSGINPHDRFEMKEGSTTYHLKGNLLHYSYQSTKEHFKKADYFSTIAAQAYFKNGKKSSFLKTIVNPVFRFIRDYFLKLGFIDGKHGFYIALIIAKEVSLKYKKLLKLQKSQFEDFIS